MKQLLKLYRFFKPYTFQIVLYVLMGLMVASIAMLAPYINIWVFDNLLPGKDLEVNLLSLFSFTVNVDGLIMFIGGVLFFQSIARNSLQYLRTLIIEMLSQRATATMRESLLSKFFAQSQAQLRVQNTGNTLTVLSNDPEVVKGFFTGTIPNIITTFSAFLMASVLLGNISLYMLLAVYAALPIIFIFARRANKPIREVSMEIRDRTAELSMAAQETINGIRVVKAAGREEHEKAKFAKANGRFMEIQFYWLKKWVHYFVPLGLVSLLPLIFLNIVGLILVLSGQLSPGGFVATGGFMGHITAFVNSLPNFISESQNGINSAAKIDQWLSAGSLVQSPPGAPRAENTRPAFAFENVSLSVNGQIILNNVSFRLPFGKSLGILGPTGSGKTMLCNLLMRYYDPTEGQVLLDGAPLSEYDLDSVRRLFSPVMQDVFLFSETLQKNVVLQEAFSEEKLTRVLQDSQSAPFIAEMDKGIETIIGERGTGLSGGQRQRVSIARALYKDAPVLLLDDASSALDNETEKKLHKAISLLPERTRVTVTHRVSSVRDCDEIIYLENGQVAESGTHQQLLAAGGPYARLVAEQATRASEEVHNG